MQILKYAIYTAFKNKMKDIYEPLKKSKTYWRILTGRILFFIANLSHSLVDNKKSKIKESSKVE